MQENQEMNLRVYPDLSAKLEDCIAHKRSNQLKMAAEIGISSSYFNQILHGKVVLSRVMYKRLKKFVENTLEE